MKYENEIDETHVEYIGWQGPNPSWLPCTR
jgi:hypothetical protein